MWEIVRHSEKEEKLISVDTFSNEKDCLEQKKSDDDLLLYSGELPDNLQAILDLEKKVSEINGRHMRISADKSNYPSNCWCLVKRKWTTRGTVRGDEPTFHYEGTIECAYTRADGYTWIVDTGRWCGGQS